MSRRGRDPHGAPGSPIARQRKKSPTRHLEKGAMDLKSRPKPGNGEGESPGKNNQIRRMKCGSWRPTVEGACAAAARRARRQNRHRAANALRRSRARRNRSAPCRVCRFPAACSDCGEHNAPPMLGPPSRERWWARCGGSDYWLIVCLNASIEVRTPASTDIVRSSISSET